MDIPSSAISSTVKRGDIYHAQFNGIDHGKFFVVMGVSEDMVCGFFFINSNINRFIFNKPELLALQYQIRHSDYSFLNYDSFICASSVKEISLSMLSDDISDRKITFVGCLKEEHVADILEMVRSSCAINNRDKSRFFY